MADIDTAIHGGLLRLHGLDDWWNTRLTEQDRQTIIERYDGHTSLTAGDHIHTSASASNFLWGLSSWYRKKTDTDLCLKIATEALRNAKTPIDKHFSILEMIKMHYVAREDPQQLQSAIDMCRAQIDIQAEVAQAFRDEYPDSPLPKHTGYHQLCIIEEKRKNYVEAARLAAEAELAGWMGDWAKRIIRCNDKRRCAKIVDSSR